MLKGFKRSQFIGTLLFEFIVEWIHVIQVECLRIQIILHVHKDLLVVSFHKIEYCQSLNDLKDPIYVLEKWLFSASLCFW